MRKIICLAFLIVTTITVTAQSPFNYRTEFTPTGTVQNETDTVFTVKLILENQNPENISKVHIKVFDSNQNNTEVINVNFNNPNSGGTSEQKYQVVGNNIEITLGNYVPYYFSFEVRIQDSQGNTSEPGSIAY